MMDSLCRFLQMSAGVAIEVIDGFCEGSRELLYQNVSVVCVKFHAGSRGSICV